MKKKHYILITITVIIIVAGIFGYNKYRVFLKENVKKSGYVFIPTGADYNEVIDSLQSSNLLEDIKSFEETATFKGYNEKIRPGRYYLTKEQTNNSLVNMFKAGNQKPVKITFNNIRKIEDFAGKVAPKLETDSADIINYILSVAESDTTTFNRNTIIAMFIPNTYEFYWNTSPEKFYTRMKNEYDNFWTKDRKSKLSATGLNQIEVSVLASIVQEEQRLHNNEKPVIAGLYINRLNKGMLLQSDPTVKYALNDFTLKRVLNKHLEVNSLYNTYKYPDLPPGPICMPDISSIDAVLDYKKHNYLYMCAKADFSGLHSFASTPGEHAANARAYHQALNKNKIWR